MAARDEPAPVDQAAALHAAAANPAVLQLLAGLVLPGGRAGAAAPGAGTDAGVASGNQGRAASFLGRADALAAAHGRRDDIRTAVAALRQGTFSMAANGSVFDAAVTNRDADMETALYILVATIKDPESFASVGNKIEGSNMRVGWFCADLNGLTWRGQALATTLARSVLKEVWKYAVNFAHRYMPEGELIRQAVANVPAFMIGNTDPGLPEVIRRGCILKAMDSDPLFRTYTDAQREALVSDFTRYRDAVGALSGAERRDAREKLRGAFNVVFTGEVDAVTMAHAVKDNLEDVSRDACKQAVEGAFARMAFIVQKGGRAAHLTQDIIMDDFDRAQARRAENKSQLEELEIHAARRRLEREL